ncbi:hypothetical protein [Shimazuella alba]|uniref:Uncharacterized protein n=1 Tax=Shimazuella alba TaxID=2690964 RepID=A0A6I4W0F3_9BACL|nr:hypothetical protein [Shimazuella alba]MXQ55685.1 hypothetical protein [Shimazuella alba]
MSSATLKRLMETFAGKPLALPYTDIEITPRKLEKVITDALKLRDDLGNYPDSLEIMLHPTGKEFLHFLIVQLVDELRQIKSA